jgi:hypothetical protein
MFQNNWATKLPWAEPIVGPHGNMHTFSAGCVHRSKRR